MNQKEKGKAVLLIILILRDVHYEGGSKIFEIIQDR